MDYDLLKTTIPLPPTLQFLLILYVPSIFKGHQSLEQSLGQQQLQLEDVYTGTSVKK